MNCYYSNLCEDKYKCCNFCDNKKCEFRCKENHNTCIYFVNKSKTVLERFKRKIADGNYKIKDLCKELDISYATIVRLLKSDDTNIWPSTLTKIEIFLEKE